MFLSCSQLRLPDVEFQRKMQTVINYQVGTKMIISNGRKQR